MPETDILNPKQGFDRELGDTMNPNYGFTRKRPTSRSIKKAVGGVPYTREMQNTGHAFTLSWLGRTWECVQRLKWYYEQYEDGFFTIVDYDGGGRNYVGRFTTEVSPVATANGKWDVQNVTFEEIPGCPMIQYPTDWEKDAITKYVSNDFGDQKLATSGAWAQAHHAFRPLAWTMDNLVCIAGEWAQYEYRGYGFRLQMLKGPTFGIVDVYLDGVNVATIDLYAAQELDPLIVLTQEEVPLNIHRVKVICTGNKNDASSAAGASWFALEVMR